MVLQTTSLSADQSQNTMADHSFDNRELYFYFNHFTQHDCSFEIGGRIPKPDRENHGPDQ